MFRSIAVVSALSLLVGTPAFAQACADVARAQASLTSGFAGEATRKDGTMEYLKSPLFGDEDCLVSRPWASSTKRGITCMVAEYVGSDEVLQQAAKAAFDKLSANLKSCLSSHVAFDNKSNENPDDEIFDRRNYRSVNGRETWSLTLENENLPKAILRIEYETDAEEAKAVAPMPAWMNGVLEAGACKLYDDMTALARKNFEGVETKRVRTEWAMTKPLAGADECFVARDRVRSENVIACNWRNEKTGHADWARTLQNIRLNAARQCRKGWKETQRSQEVEYTSAVGEKLSVGSVSAGAVSVTGVSVVVKARQ